MARRVFATLLLALTAFAVLTACTEVGFPEYQAGQGYRPNGSANMQLSY